MQDHDQLLINTVGHLAGAVVFGIFLALALRGGAGRRLRENWLVVASAGLALLWNAGSFATLALLSGPSHWIVEAVSFSSLSLLPAVLLHLSLSGKLRPVAAAGYALSAAATMMHLCEGLWPEAHLHKLALWVIMLGFSTLTVISVTGLLLQGGRETRGRTSQILASMCLLLFAVTFSHFAVGHPPRPWSMELLIHHAGIPIALFILLQDYRFVFLDAFARFFANVMLAALVGFAGVRLAAGLPSAEASGQSLRDALAVAMMCCLLLVFAYLRSVLQGWLTLAVFSQNRIEEAAQELRSKALELRNESAYLQWAGERLALAAGAERFALLEPEAFHRYGSRARDFDSPSLANDEPWLTADSGWNWAEAVVPIRLFQRDVRTLLLGRRQGGRPYLSEDLRSLGRLAVIAGGEVDRFRVTEMERLVSQAELRALHSQINPHFLFNALNALYGIIPREAAGARRTVLNLSDIFRYFLQSDKILIPLSEELKIVKAYLEIERLRLGPRLQTMIEVDKAAEQTMIPILSVQPLVENAIKHGLSARSDEGWVKLTAKLGDRGLTIVVQDSGAGSMPSAFADRSAGAGVGLANVTRRLQLCFGPEAGVNMEQGDFGTRVQFCVPLTESLSQRQPSGALRS